MSKEQQPELINVSPYDEYLDCGGCLPQNDFELIQHFISEEEVIPPSSRSTHEITHICSYCCIEVTAQEKLIYHVLRNKMNYEHESFPKNIKPVNTMTDQFLMREIFLVTDKTGEKYHRFTETFPHMFNGSN